MALIYLSSLSVLFLYLKFYRLKLFKTSIILSFCSGNPIVILTPLGNSLVIHPTFNNASYNSCGLDVCTKMRSEEHTSELQSRFDLVCRLLLEKKNHIDQAEEDVQADGVRVEQRQHPQRRGGAVAVGAAGGVVAVAGRVVGRGVGDEHRDAAVA